MVLEYIFGPQSSIILKKINFGTSIFYIFFEKSFFGPQSLIIHSKKSNFGPQSLIIHQFGSNYWTTKLFNMVDGMKIAMENET